jgi:hypothetical protein
MTGFAEFYYSSLALRSRLPGGGVKFDIQYNLDIRIPEIRISSFLRIHLLAPQGLILLCAIPRYKDTSHYP